MCVCVFQFLLCASWNYGQDMGVKHVCLVSLFLRYFIELCKFSVHVHYVFFVFSFFVFVGCCYFSLLLF